MKNKEMKLRRKKGKAEAVSKKQVKAPVRWQSSPSHPATHLAYITDAERELLANLDLHGSGVSMENPHYGPKGIPSLNGMGGPGTGGNDNGTGGLGPGGRGGTDGYGGRDTGGSSSGRGSTGQGGIGGSLGGDGTGNSGSRGNTGGASSGFGGGDGGIGGSLGGGRAGGVGRSDVGGGFSSNDRSGGIGGSLGGSRSGRAGGVGTAGVTGGFGGGGNSGIGLGVGGLGNGLGGYSGPKGGVIGPSDIGRAISGLAGTNAGRMGLAQASNALAGMRNSVSDVAWGGGGFFGEQPSTNVIDKRDDGPLPGIAPGAFGNLGPNLGGLGGLFAAGAAPSVAQQVSNAAAKGNLGQMVNRAAKGDFTGTPTAGAPGVSGGAANAGALGGMANAANVGLSSNVAAKSDMGVPSLNSRSNMAGLIASQGFGTPRETRSTPIGLSNLSQGQIDNTIAAIVGLPGASFTGLSPTGAFATNSPQAANIARSDAMQGLPSAQGYSQPTMTATPGAMQAPATSMSPRGRASLGPSMAAISARNAQPAAQAPRSTDLSGVPGAFSNANDISGYTDVTDEARNLVQGNYMDAFKGGLEKLGLGNMLSIGGLLSGMGNPNARTGRSGENRGGNEDAYYVRGLLEAMDPQTPAPEAPGTVRPGNWVPPGLLMRANPFPAVWQNRNPWQGYM